MGLLLALAHSATIKKASEHQVKQALVGTTLSQQLFFGHLRTLVAFLVTGLQETLLEGRWAWSVTEQCPRALCLILDNKQTQRCTVL